VRFRTVFAQQIFASHPRPALSAINQPATNTVQTVDQTAWVGRVMDLVPRHFRVALIGLALAGLSNAALAGGLMPGNGGSITLPAILPPSVQNFSQPVDGSSGLGLLAQKFGVQNGRLDFFSTTSSNSGDFKPLLRGGVGDGGLKLQLKW
jgi:hypothetical protein